MIVKRTNIFIRPNPNRVLLIPFELHDKQRINRIVNYVFNLFEQDVNKEVQKVHSEFDDRHRNFKEEGLIRC